MADAADDKPKSAPKDDGTLMDMLNKNPKTVLFILTLVLGGTNLGGLANSAMSGKSGNPAAIQQFEKIDEKLDAIHDNQILIKSEMISIKEDVKENKEDIRDIVHRPRP